MRTLSKKETGKIAGGMLPPPGGGAGGGEGGSGGTVLLGRSDLQNLANQTGLQSELNQLGLQVIAYQDPRVPAGDSTVNGSTIKIPPQYASGADPRDAAALGGLIAHEMGHYENKGNVDLDPLDFSSEGNYTSQAMTGEGWAQISAIQQAYNDSFFANVDSSDAVPGDTDGLAASTYWNGIANGTPMDVIAGQIGFIMENEAVGNNGETYGSYYDDAWEQDHNAQQRSTPGETGTGRGSSPEHVSPV